MLRRSPAGARPSGQGAVHAARFDASSAITDSEQLAKTREQFLTAEAVDPNQVRDAILASWWRSRRWNVAADRLDLPYLRDPDLDTPLTRSALPVLRHLREHLDGQPISIILTDPAGLVLTRMDAGRDLDAHLDRVKLAPGLQLRRGVRRHQRHRHRAGGRPADARLRPRALRREPRGPRLRRRADPPPDLRQDGRRGRPHLLAQGRRPAAARPWPRPPPGRSSRRC